MGVLFVSFSRCNMHSDIISTEWEGRGKRGRDWVGVGAHGSRMKAGLAEHMSDSQLTNTCRWRKNLDQSEEVEPGANETHAAAQAAPF